MSQQNKKSKQSPESYAFREGYRCPVKAAVVASELERLRAAGPLTSHAVFDAARPNDAPLHDAGFVWDGDKAIEALGLIQARRLIRAVCVVSKSDDEEQVSHRVYVQLAGPEPTSPGRYELMTTVVGSPDLYQQAFAHLQAEFEAAEEALAELRQVAEASPDAERLARLGIVISGFSALREAIALLKV